MPDCFLRPHSHSRILKLLQEFQTLCCFLLFSLRNGVTHFAPTVVCLCIGLWSTEQRLVNNNVHFQDVTHTVILGPKPSNMLNIPNLWLEQSENTHGRITIQDYSSVKMYWAGLPKRGCVDLPSCNFPQMLFTWPEGTKALKGMGGLFFEGILSEPDQTFFFLSTSHVQVNKGNSWLKYVHF